LTGDKVVYLLLMGRDKSTQSETSSVQYTWQKILAARSDL